MHGFNPGIPTAEELVSDITLYRRNSQLHGWYSANVGRACDFASNLALSGIESRKFASNRIPNRAALLNGIANALIFSRKFIHSDNDMLTVR